MTKRRGHCRLEADSRAKDDDEEQLTRRRAGGERPEALHFRQSRVAQWTLLEDARRDAVQWDNDGRFTQPPPTPTLVTRPQRAPLSAGNTVGARTPRKSKLVDDAAPLADAAQVQEQVEASKSLKAVIRQHRELLLVHVHPVDHVHEFKLHAISAGSSPAGSAKGSELPAPSWTRFRVITRSCTLNIRLSAIRIY